MRFDARLRGQPSLLVGFLVWLGSALAAGAAGDESARRTITLDKVVVHGFVGIFDTPEVAHLDPPAGPSGSREGPEANRSAPDLGQTPARPTLREGLAPRGRAQSATAGHRAERGPTVGLGSWGSAVSPLGSAPGQGTANPSFIEHGFRVEAFWAARIGTSEGRFKRAHFHPPDLSSGFEALHLGNPDELHGIHITSPDGSFFGLNGLRYRVTRNRHLVWKPFSIEGFSNFNVQLLVARSFDPRRTVRTQFATFPVGLPVGNDPSLPWWTLQVSGFELVDQVYIASSASVDIDDIVVTKVGKPR